VSGSNIGGRREGGRKGGGVFLPFCAICWPRAKGM